MSPEWMIAIDAAGAKARGKPERGLSDPLEGRDWQGLERVAVLLSCLISRSESRSMSQTDRSPGTAAMQEPSKGL